MRPASSGAAPRLQPERFDKSSGAAGRGAVDQRNHTFSRAPRLQPERFDKSSGAAGRGAVNPWNQTFSRAPRLQPERFDKSSGAAGRESIVPMIDKSPTALTRRKSLKTIAALAALQQSSSAAAPASPKIRLVVLDVGGTIVQEKGDVPLALRSAFSKHGITVTPEEIAEWRGASKREIVRHFVKLRAEATAGTQLRLNQAIYKEFSRQVDEAYRTALPIEGAEEAFRQMRSRGLLLAATSGFDRELLVSLFQRLRWMDYFAALVSSEDVARGRPSPFMIFHAMETAAVDSVAEVVTAGDTPLDLRAGANAGLRGNVGVLSGASGEDKLRPEPHTHILRSVADLPALLREAFA